MSPHPGSASPARAGHRYLLIALAAFVLLLVALLWGAGAGQAQSDAVVPGAEVVVTDQVHIQQGFEVRVTLRGLVESAQRAQLSFDIAGTLVALEADEGQQVAAGAPLATLDTARLEARQQELQAALTRAKAEAELACLSKVRVDELVGKQLESGQRRDEVRAQLQAAQAQVAEVEAALLSVQVEREKSQLNAPFDGQLVARYVDEGSTVTPGSAVFLLTNNHRLQARFAVPAHDIDDLSLDQRVQVQVDGQPYAGTVTQRVSQRSTQTRTVDMLVTLHQAPSVLPGDMAMMTLTRQRPEQGAWVPVTALSNGLRGLWTLFIVDSGAAGEAKARVQARSVEVIYTDGQRAFVRGALRDNEQFVRGGTHKLSPGQWVVRRSAAIDTARVEK